MEPPLKRRRLTPLPRNLVLSQIENWMTSKSASPLKTPEQVPPTHIDKVLELVFNYLDVKRLKISRLVSKTWNRAVCSSLKNRSAVEIKIRGHSNIEEEFSKLTSRGAKLGLPLPFKFYRLDIEDHFKHTTKSLLNGKTGYIDKFKINIRNSNEDYMLESNFRFLTDLSLSSFGPLTSRLSSWKPQKLNHLRKLTISQSHSYFSNVFVDTVNSVLTSAKELKELRIINCDARIISPVLQHKNIKEITSLSFDIETDWMSETRRILQQSPFTKLKTLEILSQSKENNGDVLTIIKLFSENLEQLSLKWLESFDAKGPSCPNLKNLTIFDWVGNFGYLKPNLAPSLKTLSLRTPRAPSSTVGAVPHMGVTTLKICPGESDFDEGISLKEFQLLLKILAEQFPKVKRLVFDGLPNQAKHFENEVIGYSTQVFPKIESFHCLNSSWDLSKDRSKQFDWVIKDHYKMGGEGLMEAPVKLSLCDWTNLHLLDISTKTLTHSEILSFTFIPALKSLEFYWNDQLMVSVVAKILQNMRTIRIKNCCTPAYSNSMELLFSSLAFVQCACRKELLL